MISGGFTDFEFSVLELTILVPAYAQQIALAIMFGILVGLEREKKGKPASIRTFSVISAGSCLFTVLSVEAVGGLQANPYDITRVAAQIVSGIGFLGGGVIFKTSDRIEGITTAALIWLVAALGMACGFNAISIALWSFFLFVMTHVTVGGIYNVLYLLRGTHANIEDE